MRNDTDESVASSHRTHENSLIAYHAILEHLPRSRRLVMEAIIQHGRPLTRQQVCEITGRPTNTVTARIRELLDTGELEECGSVMGPEKKPRALLRPKPLAPQGELF